MYNNCTLFSLLQKVNMIPFHGWHPKHWLPGHLGAGTVPDNNEKAWEDANKLTKQNNQKWDKNCCKCGNEYKRRSEGTCD